MTNTAIDIQNLTKSYVISGNLKAERPSLWGFKSAKKEKKENQEDVVKKIALDNISLHIERGERVGIIGSNGSGKTTLLKIIAGHTGATSGTARVVGDVKTMMQTGYGFEAHLTGRQNVRNSIIFNGLTGSACDLAEQDVEEFAELGEFLDYPLTTYSLGMRARLEFAVATAIHPDILIIDEMLGAGDGYFAKKSAARMQSVISESTLLLVSHSLGQIMDHCNRVIWIEQGVLRADGEPEAVIKQYQDHMAEREATIKEQIASDDRNLALEEDGARIRFIQRDLKRYLHQKDLLSEDDAEDTVTFGDLGFGSSMKKLHSMETGDALTVKGTLTSSLDANAVKNARLTLFGYSEHSALIFRVQTSKAPRKTAKGWSVSGKTDAFNLGVGKYYLIPVLTDSTTGKVVGMAEQALTINMRATNISDPPYIHLSSSWSDQNNKKIASRVSAWV